MEHDPVKAFAALAHPQRLAIFRLLMQGFPQRLAAGDIGTALDLRASTLSGYLAQLLGAGLITQERQGTSLRYAASPEGAAALGEAWLGPITGGRGWPTGWQMPRRVCNVLFLGQGNAGPSLIAEALLRSAAGAHFEVFSAGLDPAPQARPEILAALGEAAADLWPKPLALWQGADAPRMHVVITLGRRAAAASPEFPLCPHRAAWLLASGQEPQALIADLTARLVGLCALDPANPPPARLQAVLDASALD